MKIELRTVETTPNQVTSQNAILRQNQNNSSQQVKEKLQVDPSYELTLQEKTILNIIEEVNKKLQGSDRELERSIHEKTNQVMIKVVDVKTKEVLKEFPPEKILDMIAAMCEQAGIFIDEKI